MAATTGDVDRVAPLLGRRPVTSRSELEQISLTMFSAQGFEVTSVDEIAAAAGIGRRTFFRYFKSKNDAVWGDFDSQLDRFREWFDNCSPDVPLAEAIRAAVIDFNSFDEEATRSLRDRMRIILGSPALQAYSTLRYAAWREVVANFAAGRLGRGAADLIPRTLGYLALGAAIAAYERWLEVEDQELIDLLRESLSTLNFPDFEATHGQGSAP